MRRTIIYLALGAALGFMAGCTAAPMTADEVFKKYSGAQPGGALEAEIRATSAEIAAGRRTPYPCHTASGATGRQNVRLEAGPASGRAQGECVASAP